MAPSGRSTRNSRKTQEKKQPQPRTTHQKKQLLHQQSQNIKEASNLVAISPAKKKINNIVEDKDLGIAAAATATATANNGSCSTPKAKKFRIPEITTCPPAPKKKRVLSDCISNLRRSPIAFFSPPDIEIFFSSLCSYS